MTDPHAGPPPGWQPSRPPVPPIPPAPVTTSHVVHLIITILTCGLWAIMWLIIAAQDNNVRAQRRRQYQADVQAYTEAQWHWEQQNRRY